MRTEQTCQTAVEDIHKNVAGYEWLFMRSLVVGQLLFYRGEISEILEVLPDGMQLKQV
jgi:hypothetical protein